MQFNENCFTHFKKSINSFSLPKKFTFPFYYDPHPLCLLAAKELQEHLEQQSSWQHPFGLKGDTDHAIGKMFGVLLVKNQQGEVGYLSAFSGKLANQNHLPKFVPPVFDMLAENSFFTQCNIEINKLNHQLERLEYNPNIKKIKQDLEQIILASEKNIQQQRNKMIVSRKRRKEQRLVAEKEMSSADFEHFKHVLAKQSVQEKNQLKELKNDWHHKIALAQSHYDLLIDEIKRVKDHRKKLSLSLQKKLFNQYQFLNIQGKEKNLLDIFTQTPPAGSGECAAPKLLQYAFLHNMKPLAMAEFWWGASPKSAIRKHKNFYPSCQGKCQPILGHMLEGMSVDDNPLLVNPAEDKALDIVYEDDDILIVNKPAELLSVQGKHIQDSVHQRIKQSHPHATGPLIVHRLDMSTSGLMVIALTKEAHKFLQRQFIKRSVKKRYVALLDGILKEKGGMIDLPLRVDLDDRPKQLVCYEHGKKAQTRWELVSTTQHHSKVNFYPITGRTHQLRVHAAHFKGLNMPIVGDDLYGRKDQRLHLHAELLELIHPKTRKLVSFSVEANF